MGKCRVVAEVIGKDRKQSQRLRLALVGVHRVRCGYLYGGTLIEIDCGRSAGHPVNCNIDFTEATPACVSGFETGPNRARERLLLKARMIEVVAY